jgi:F420-dependent methylenetetrahydromethanopterin dehydrogenase
LPKYLGKKGENLADKEDIAKITREIEQVKSQYQEKLQEIILQNNKMLQQQEWENQIKLVALEKRLEKHQEAYSLL